MTHSRKKYACLNNFQCIPLKINERTNCFWIRGVIFRLKRKDIFENTHIIAETDHTCSWHKHSQHNTNTWFEFLYIASYSTNDVCVFLCHTLYSTIYTSQTYCVYVYESSHHITLTLFRFTAEDNQGLKLILSSSAIVQYADSFCKYHIAFLQLVFKRRKFHSTFPLCLFVVEFWRLSQII